jgi:hypothetical protein
MEYRVLTACIGKAYCSIHLKSADAKTITKTIGITVEHAYENL